MSRHLFTCTFAQRAQATSLIKKTRILRSHTAACCGSTRLYKSDGQSVRWSDGRSWGVPPRVGNRRVILIATKWKLASLPDGHTLNFAQAHTHTHTLETTGHPTDAAFHMLQTQKCATPPVTRSLETPGHRRVIDIARWKAANVLRGHTCILVQAAKCWRVADWTLGWSVHMQCLACVTWWCLWVEIISYALDS